MKQGECPQLYCCSLTWGAVQCEGCELRVDAAMEQDGCGTDLVLDLLYPSKIAVSAGVVTVLSFFQLKLASHGCNPVLVQQEPRRASLMCHLALLLSVTKLQNMSHNNSPQ